MPNIFGWLSCDYSLIGGLLRPRRDLLSIIFCRPNPLPNSEVTSPHTLHPPRTTSPISLLPWTSTFGWLLCLPGFKFRPLRPSHHFLSICWCLLCRTPQTWQPMVALPNQTMGTWHGTIGGRGTMQCGLCWPTHGSRRQSHWEVGQWQLMLVVVCFVLCDVASGLVAK